MAAIGDKVWLKAKPQFYKPAASAINGFYRNGAVPSDTITNDFIEENYNDCTYLGEVQEIEGKRYYLVRLNFTYRKHGFLGIGKDVKSSEDLYFREEEMSFEYMQTKEDKEEAEREELKQKILNGNNTPLTTGSGDDSGGSGNTWIVVGIVSVVAALGGVLWWAFRKPATPAPPAPAPTIIQLPKKGK
ncbi:hypothetical protein [Runella zeae]|uniref:hypothetical protein n=1 Tax=Runella zeae TaxID=94255 RepID=UPI0023541137|nr:hypothetical protein [Runella zeae]